MIRIIRTQGFTLIELLVVIAIIGLLASIVLASLNTARSKGRDAQAISEMKEMQNALEVYYLNNKSYPVTSGWQAGTTACNDASHTYGTGHSYTGATGYIPNLAPTYISVLPEVLDLSPGNCFLYQSNGTDYKLMDWNAVENYDPNSPLADPGYNGTPPNCTSSPRVNSYSVYTAGGKCF